VSRGRRGAPDAGFTLLELSAVVVILVLLVGMVLPSLGLGERRALDGEAEGLRADLELARQRAIATGAPHRLTVDLDDASYRLEQWGIEPAPPQAATETEAFAPGARRPAVDLTPPRASAGSFAPVPTRHGRARILSEDVFVARVETAEGEARHGTASVTFFEDGSATPARIRLETHSGEALELDVLPLADTVRVRAVD